MIQNNKIKEYIPIIDCLKITLIIYLLHKILFQYSNIFKNKNNFQYTINELYLYFISTTIVMIAILIVVKKKNFDNVGITFLLVTSIKMALSYIMLRPILNNTESSSNIEKMNFFALFAIFLTIETFTTIKLVNKNDKEK